MKKIEKVLTCGACIALFFAFTNLILLTVMNVDTQMLDRCFCASVLTGFFCIMSELAIIVFED